MGPTDKGLLLSLCPGWPGGEGVPVDSEIRLLVVCVQRKQVG